MIRVIGKSDLVRDHIPYPATSIIGSMEHVQHATPPVNK